MSDTTLSKTIASTATLKIANIHTLDLFYTPIEERFERITRLGRRALHVPVAAISLLNEDKQWFKSAAGWGVSEIPRAQAICRLTVEENRLLAIPDTLQDPRVATSPIVAQAPRFRSYAGHPLADEHGNVIGTFCVFDLQPREFSAADRQTITDLAALAQRELLNDQLSSAQAALTSKLSLARREALMDPLTHLWNRRGASVLLKAAFRRADERRAPLTLALLDLDNFKRINDSYGHQSGDEVLRKISSRLLTAVRSEDNICRIGGDEFLVLMTDTDAKIASRIAERIRRTITDTPIPTRDGAMSISVSVGFTVRQPNDDTAAEALIERADQALMQSKAAGRNRVRMTS
ncbi:MAG TPA: sensor domain-containing diguanylate cyclase [Gammaproteobacteria bacterium]|nr:sensor domain-containing diguanylate cyclase [Gammaproteobacteria bacterium]